MEKPDNPTPLSRLNEPARGVLKESALTPPFSHERYLPHEGLKDLIEFFWHVAWDLPKDTPFTQRVLSHPNVHIVFESQRLYIAGPDTACFERTLQGHGDVFSAKLLPGHISRLLPTPATQFTNAGDIPLSQHFDAHDVDALLTSLKHTHDIQARVLLMSQFLLAHRQPATDAHRQAERITTWIATHPEAQRVQDICGTFHIHERTLQRLFSQHVGVSPKWVIGRYRMHEAALRLEAGSRESLTELAYALGYFDQAHFTREFKKFTGDTPSNYRARSSVTHPPQ